ncbi:hypothetical protein GNE10_17265 [Nostoc sp. 2RC]|nr:hypothetical protein [Nostoc sp. 2RC]
MPNALFLRQKSNERRPKTLPVRSQQSTVNDLYFFFDTANQKLKLTK